VPPCLGDGDGVLLPQHGHHQQPLGRNGGFDLGAQAGFRGAGFRAYGFRVRVQGAGGSGNQGSGFRVQGVQGTRVQGPGFRGSGDQSSGFKVIGFRGVGFRVWGSGFRARGVRAQGTELTLATWLMYASLHASESTAHVENVRSLGVYGVRVRGSRLRVCGSYGLWLGV